MKVLVKFARFDALCMISHLDLLRTVQRSLRRAELPILYSQGFNPHPILSFGQALGVGLATEGDYFAVGLADSFDTTDFCRRFNEAAPHGLSAICARPMSEKEKDPMARIKAARYRLYTDNQSIAPAVSALWEKEEYLYLRRTKSGERMDNMRPLIFDKSVQDNMARITVACGDNNLPPTALAEAIEKIGEMKCGSVHFVREDLLWNKNGAYISIFYLPNDSL